MGYYQGDFYAGARGDPFWGALLGLAKTVGSKVLGGLKHIPSMPGGGGGGGGMRRAGETVQRAIIKHPVLSAAGAAGAMGALGGAGAEKLMAHAGACPKGFHISKKHGHCVRNRRMNVANGRALSRAVRRLHHFARKYRKVVGFVSPRKPKGRMYFRKRKKAA